MTANLQPSQLSVEGLKAPVAFAAQHTYRLSPTLHQHQIIDAIAVHIHHARAAAARALAGSAERLRRKPHRNHRRLRLPLLVHRNSHRILTLIPITQSQRKRYLRTRQMLKARKVLLRFIRMPRPLQRARQRKLRRRVAWIVLECPVKRRNCRRKILQILLANAFKVERIRVCWIEINRVLKAAQRRGNIVRRPLRQPQVVPRPRTLRSKLYRMLQRRLRLIQLLHVEQRNAIVQRGLAQRLVLLLRSGK